MRVTDLLDVLDTPDEEPSVDLDLLSRMRTPGALELLAVYEQLPAEARTSLVSFLRVLTPAAAESLGQVTKNREPA